MMSIGGILKTYALVGIPEESTVNILITVVNLAGILSRLVWPWAQDYLGYKNVMIVMFSSAIVVCLTMPWSD